MTNQRRDKLLKGKTDHARSEADYMGALLDTVTLDDWREVVTATVQAAKNGDHNARNWLGSYLMGRPDHKAPPPVTVVVNQLMGRDPVVTKLADRLETPTFTFSDGDKRQKLTAQITAELAELQTKLPGDLGPT